MKKPRIMPDDELSNLTQAWMNPEEVLPPCGKKIAILGHGGHIGKAEYIVPDGSPLYLISSPFGTMEIKPWSVKYWIPLPE